uniref:Replication protein 1a n=1 Tax=Lygus hesperus TaxID=30085 RepID=A0A0A9WWM4_LYGHE
MLASIQVPVFDYMPLHLHVPADPRYGIGALIPFMQFVSSCAAQNINGTQSDLVACREVNGEHANRHSNNGLELSNDRANMVKHAHMSQENSSITLVHDNTTHTSAQSGEIVVVDDNSTTSTERDVSSHSHTYALPTTAVAGKAATTSAKDVVMTAPST